MVGRNGLRVAGGTQLTTCCGKEALPPMPEEQVPEHCESGWVKPETDIRYPHEDEYDDAVDLVCPGCGRTWRSDDCEHDQVAYNAESLEDVAPDASAIWIDGTCLDCGADVSVYFDRTDARTRSEDLAASLAHKRRVKAHDDGGDA